jgi:DNA-binding PadR family transcriptional regulator
MDVLKDGPKHGYEIIKQLEERTQGIYSPSPGTLYPTLQLLEDQGIVRSDQESDRRVYHLTGSGHAELDKNAALVEGFWARFRERTPSGPNLHELKFAGDALKDLLRTLGGGMRHAALSGDPETVRKVRLALERCENEIREIIAQGATGSTTPHGGENQPE